MKIKKDQILNNLFSFWNKKNPLKEFERKPTKLNFASLFFKKTSKNIFSLQNKNFDNTQNLVQNIPELSTIL